MGIEASIDSTRHPESLAKMERANSMLSCPALCRASRLGTHSASLSEMAGEVRAFTPVFDGLCPAMTIVLLQPAVP